MINSGEIADQIENEYAFESQYLRAEKNHQISELFNSVLTKKVRKLTRQEAKSKYLYRRLNGELKLV